MIDTGKSTISRTIAHNFTRHDQLDVSFFFKRDEEDHDNVFKFFTTIVTQLMQSLSDLKLYFKNVLKINSVIFTKIMKEQFEKLIFELLFKLTHLLKTLIVVDALNECENEDHVIIILHLLKRIQFIESVKLRVLVTSRSELLVHLDFKRISELHRDFILHVISLPVIKHDIEVFLENELSKIRDVYNCMSFSDVDISSDWSTKRNMQVLVNMTVSLFIFVAIMCRFIEDHSNWDSVGKLVKILHYQSVDSLTQLKKTYVSILNQILQGNSTRSEKESRIQEFWNIVDFIVILFEPLFRASLTVLLDTSRTAIYRRLHTLHSVLRVSIDLKSSVRSFHLSFRDFLVDSEHKQSQFWIDEKEIHKKIVFRCLDLLSKTLFLKQDICFLKKSESLQIDINDHLIEQCLSTEMQYACRYWAHYLEQGNCRIFDQDKVHNFLNQRFLYWVETLSIIERVTDSISMIVKLQNLLEVKQFLPHFWHLLI